MDSMQAHNIVNAELAEMLATQDWKRIAHYSTPNVICPANSTTPVVLTVTQEADFVSEIITGKIVPTNITTFTGMLVQIFDNNTELTDGFVPLENILSPGYGGQLFFPHKFSHVFERNNNIRLNFMNASAEAQTVSLTFTGEKLK